MMLTTTHHIEVPLDHLEPAKSNARRTPATAADHEQLVASIRAHGLLTPLLVRERGGGVDAESETYLVVDGARRLAALRELDEPAPVPCTREMSETHAGELSVAGNLHVALHPADQVEAFERMRDAGETIEAVADRFGVTVRTVRRRLALAGVAPAVRAAWRDGKISSEHAAAFASSADHDAQAKVLAAELRDSWRSPHPDRIRNLLNPRGESPTLDQDRLGRYVGLAAYENAGGEVWRDLFADEETAPEGIRLENRELVRQLAQKKLDRKARALTKQGWAWVETDLDTQERYSLKTGGYGRLEYASEYPAEQMALAGCIVIVSYQGAEVAAGLVRITDLPAVRALTGSEDPDGSGGGPREPFDPEAPPAPADGIGYSGGLESDLRRWRTDIVQSALARNPGAALDLLAFQLALDVLLPEISGEHHYGNPYALATTLTGDAESAPVWTFASPERTRLLDTLPLQWLAEPDEDRWTAFETALAGDDTARDRILAAALAPALHSRLCGVGANEIEGYEETVGRLDIQWDGYRPDVEGFYGRLTKTHLLDLLADACGTATDERVKHAKTMKKGELASYVAERIAEDFPHWTVPGFTSEETE